MSESKPRVGGWRHEIRPGSWSEIESFLVGVSTADTDFEHMTEIVRTIRLSTAAEDLVGTTSMHDLVVAEGVRAASPPYEVIIVRAPGALRRPRPGHVVVEHLSLTGHDDRIERPVAEAVPLFWRFVAEKFGIENRAAGDGT